MDDNQALVGMAATAMGLAVIGSAVRRTFADIIVTLESMERPAVAVQSPPERLAKSAVSVS